MIETKVQKKDPEMQVFENNRALIIYDDANSIVKASGNKIKVRIMRSSGAKSWYADLIGRKVMVIDAYKSYYVLDGDFDDVEFLIKKQDAEQVIHYII